jgi:acyl-CoA thioester hydrolase
MALGDFRFVHRQPVVLRDLDGFGHVNNAVYLTYVENARVAYLREVVGAATIAEIANVMATVTLTFREPLGYGDELEIGVRTSRVGGKSFGLEYEVWTADGRLAAEASTVQVMFDSEAGQSMAVPETWRAALVAYDAGD